MLIIGLTGGIASGKSTCSAIFKDMGLPVVDLDGIAHRILERGQTGYARVVQEFKNDVPNLVNEPNGEINREALGAHIFSDPGLRKKLNRITHPLIFIGMVLELLGHYYSGARVCILDAPLLFESNMRWMCYRVLVVTVPEELQISRIRERDALNAADARKRIDAQMPQEEKLRLADHVIDNSGSLDQLRQVSKAMILRASRTHFPHLHAWLLPCTRHSLAAPLLFILAALAAPIVKLNRFLSRST